MRRSRIETLGVRKYIIDLSDLSTNDFGHWMGEINVSSDVTPEEEELASETYGMYTVWARSENEALVIARALFLEDELSNDSYFLEGDDDPEEEDLFEGQEIAGNAIDFIVNG